MTSKCEWTLKELAQSIDARVEGDPNCKISHLNTLQDARPGDLAFLANPAYQRFLATTQASAVLLKEEMATQFSGNKLILANPYLGYAHLTRLFDPAPIPVSGVHPTAVLGEGVRVPASASIGPHVTLGDHVILGEGVAIGAGCVIGDYSTIGAGSRLHASVTLYHGVVLGRDVTLHSGVVIGADGFGFAPGQEGWVKIRQIGGVIIGDRVEIGACTTVDRGALDDTVIGDGVIIDNQVQIAHNVRIGANTAIAGCTGIAGSTTIGRDCTIAGAVSIVGHITIADKVHITANTLVNKSITESGGSFSSGIVMSPSNVWRKNAVRFGQLDQLANRLIAVEKTVRRNEDK